MYLIFKSIFGVLLMACWVVTACAAPIVLTDMLGNRVTLVKPVTKSVTLPMPAGSLFMSLDGGVQHLAGMHPDAKRLVSQSLLARIYPDALRVRADITQSGFMPNIETMLHIGPDLIWQWGHMGDELLTPLREAGLPTAALLYGTEERTREWIRLMGKALGKDQQAAAQLQWRMQVEQSIRRITADIPVKARPKVLYLSRYAPQYRAPGKNGSFEFDIALAGGINVSSAIGNAPTVNIEQILVWQPDVILLNNFEAKLTPQTIYDDPLFADIPAVRHRRVYKVPAGGYLWDPPSQESPLYWQWLSQILHPDKFNWSMRELVTNAYIQLYGYTPSSKDMDDLFHMTANRKAAGYERFAR